jgi:large subunit ribosomal protein L24
VSVPRIKKNDVVIAISGSDAGKTGKVLQILASGDRAVVEGLNLMSKAIRKSQDRPQGGIIEKEGPMAMAKLMLYCPDCKKGVRISREKDGEKSVRRCQKCDHSFDN